MLARPFPTIHATSHPPVETSFLLAPPNRQLALHQSDFKGRNMIATIQVSICCSGLDRSV